MLYNRKNSWDQCKFEAPDHRMVAMKTLIIWSDYISVDHNGKKMSKFKDKILENYKLRHCKLNYIAVDHRSKESSLESNQWLDYIFEDKLKEEFQVDHWGDNISVDTKGEKVL